MTTQMVDKSNFDREQYKADLQSAYDCGYVKGAIGELEHLKDVIRFNGLYNERIEDLIDIEIAGWKEGNNGKT